ncbi:MAG TPA: hypothetical protein VK843_17930 [Planctomycetota bacterium]|nr:hypothetical protein [Planctomycetota bacterium]
MTNYLPRWEAAKTAFTNATGVKKPAPAGAFKAFFNYTSLTGALKDADKALTDMERGKTAEMPKLIAAAEKSAATLAKSITTYIKVLEDSAKDEKAENNAKTGLYRHLKVLTAELKAIIAHAVQKVDATRISLNAETGAKEKAAKMMKTSLASCCANANLAIKTVQATPTPETFKKFFTVSDPPGRKIQVQLVAARNQLAEGKLPNKNVDPGHVADKFTPWQASGSANNNMVATATPAQVKTRIDQFKEVCKLAQMYSDSL